MWLLLRGCLFIANDNTTYSQLLQEKQNIFFIKLTPVVGVVGRIPLSCKQQHSIFATAAGKYVLLDWHLVWWLLRRPLSFKQQHSLFATAAGKTATICYWIVTWCGGCCEDASPLGNIFLRPKLMLYFGFRRFLSKNLNSCGNQSFQTRSKLKRL